MKKDSIQTKLENLINKGWFKNLQEKFTMNFVLYCNDLNSDKLFTTYECYPCEERPVLTKKGEAQLIAELWKNNIIANNIFADYDDSFGPKLAFISFEINNKTYEIEEDEFGLTKVNIYN